MKDPKTYFPPRQFEEYPESIRVKLYVDEEEYSGYYNHEEDSWWIEWGGSNVGHHAIDKTDIQGWEYLIK